MASRISVIVPIYNVEPYLNACLTSLASQTHAELEVILVDDGSTDGSAAIAADWTARDVRFSLLQQPNRGQGAARNAGLERATGEYVGFLDSDDVMAPNAYALLLASLDSSGSDFAGGVVRRFGRGSTRKSALTPYTATRRGTHLRTDDELLVDRIVTNKLWRRSFWDRHNLRFPEGTLYEDVVVAVGGHVHATGVDVLRETVYWWRERWAGDASTTQNRALVHGIAHRIDAVQQLRQLMDQLGEDKLQHRFSTAALTRDLMLFVDVADKGDDEYRRALARAVAEYLDSIHPQAVDELKAIERLKLHLAGRERIPELLEVLAFARHELADARSVRRDDQWFGVYPFFEVPDAGVPASSYRLDSELEVRASVTAVRVRRNRLTISGYAYIDQIDAPSPAGISTSIVLRPGTDEEVVVAAVQRVEPRATIAAGQATHRYDGAGFDAEVDLEPVLTDSGDDAIDLAVVVECGGVRRRGPLPATALALADWPTPAKLSKGRMLRVQPDGATMTLAVERSPADVATLAADAGGLVARGRVRVGKREIAHLTLRRSTDGFVRELPVDCAPLEAGSTSADVQVGFSPEVLAELACRDDEPALIEQLDEGVAWSLRLRFRTGSPVALTVPPGVDDARITVKGREFVLQPRRNGALTLVEQWPRPTGLQATLDGRRLTITGTAPPEVSGRAAVVLRRRTDIDEHLVPVVVTDGQLTADLHLDALPAPAGPRPIAAGTWDLSIAGPDPQTSAAMRFKAATGLRSSLPLRTVSGDTACELQASATGSLALVVTPAPRQSRTDEAQRIRKAFGFLRRHPLRRAVLFATWEGRRWGGDVRAVQEELARRAEHDAIVVSETGPGSIDGATVVAPGSADHVEALARCRWLVTDGLLPDWWRPTRGQRVAIMWRGTPLKRTGFDLPGSVGVAVPRYLRELRRQSSAWALVISPSPVATPYLRTALGYEGTVVETGAPRLDIHRRVPEVARRRAAVRADLGVAESAVAVLWAPTARDEGLSGRKRVDLDVRLDADAVRAGAGGAAVVLVAGHPALNERPPVLGTAEDVTGYPDAGDLLLAADLLISDYSALIVDFLHTGRPVVLYVPDADDYVSAGPGLAVDLLARPPGPTAGSAADLPRAVSEALHGGAASQAAAWWRGEWSGVVDGGAASRALDAVLSA